MILLIDNYDSFVHNLDRYFQRLGEEVEVVRNTAIDAAGVRARRAGESGDRESGRESGDTNRLWLFE